MTTYTVTLSQVGMQGPKGANWRGTWAAGLDFIVNDVVHREGSTYICTKQHTSAAENEPSVGVDEATYWGAFTLSGSSAAAVDAANSAAEAATAETNAAASETAAAASEAAAGTSETNAAASAAAASTSETNAAASKTAAETARDEAEAVAPSLSAAIGNVSAILGQAYEEIERLSETQQGDAYTLNLVLELASLIGSLSDQINGGQVTLRGGTLADPALRIGTVGVYSSANDTLSIAIAGSEVARFTASGVTIYGTVTETP